MLVLLVLPVLIWGVKAQLLEGSNKGEEIKSQTRIAVHIIYAVRGKKE
jgi:hypothetical protein